MSAIGLSGFGRICRRATAAAAVAIALVTPARALAQNATAVFERAKTIEGQLDAAPTVDALRKAARAYENVVLRRPRLGH